MKKLKTGIALVVLGNLLYLAYLYFCKNETGAFADFGSGLLLGISMGCNLVGIVLTVICMADDRKKQ